MFLNLISAQHSRLVRQPLLWVEMGVLVLLVVMLSTIPQALRNADPNREIGLGPDLGAELLTATGTAGHASLGGLLLIILAGASMAREYSWRSLHLWLSRGASRRHFLWSKFASFLGVTLLIPFTAALAAVPGTAYFIHATHGEVDITSSGLLQLLVSIPLAGYALLPYLALAILLAVWGRTQAVAIGVGLAFALLFEGMILQLLSSAGGVGLAIGQYFPSMLGYSLLNSEGGSVSPGPAAVFILTQVVMLLWASTAILQRQDLTE